MRFLLLLVPIIIFGVGLALAMAQASSDEERRQRKAMNFEWYERANPQCVVREGLELRVACSGCGSAKLGFEQMEDRRRRFCHDCGKTLYFTPLACG